MTGSVVDLSPKLLIHGYLVVLIYEVVHGPFQDRFMAGFFSCA